MLDAIAVCILLLHNFWEINDTFKYFSYVLRLLAAAKAKKGK